MSLLHLDFPSGQTGLYGTDTSYMLNGAYAEVRQGGSRTRLIEDPDPNISGNVIRFDGDSTPGTGGFIRRVLPASVTTLGISSRLWLPSLPSNNSARPEPMSLRNTSNTVLCSFAINTDGTISAYRGTSASGTLLGTTSTPAIVANAWQHVETKVVLSDTVGTFEIRVEGVTVLTLTGQDTLNAAGPCTQYGIGVTDAVASTNPIFYIKDIAVWDTAGSLNNDFMGSIGVYELIPNGDTALTWSLSSGSTGYTLIDEAPPVDSDYIYAVDPAPAADKMSLTNLPTDVTSVRGLIAIVRSLKTDGGDGNLQVGMVSGVDTALGSDRPITTAATYWQDVFEVDPATSAAWTPVAVDAVQIQFDRTV